MKRVVFAAMLLAVAIPGAEKQRDWQTGKILDTDEARVYLGSRDTHAIYGTDEIEVIESGEYVYVVSRQLRHAGLHAGLENDIRGLASKPAHFTVNAPVLFAVEKHSMYLQDDDGRQIKTKIVKRILKAEAANSAK